MNPKARLSGVSQCTILGAWVGDGAVDLRRSPCLAILDSGNMKLDVAPRNICPNRIDFDIFRELMRHCDRNHKVCHRNESQNVVGLRVIDVQTQTVIRAPDNCNYLALSYVWGKPTDSDLSDDLRKPPLVIEDAISVTRTLGYKYLWVDRYVSL